MFCTKPLHECGLGMFYANDLWAHTPSLIIIQIHQHYKQLATDIVCVLLIKPCFFQSCRVWVLWSSHQVMHHMCLPCYLWLNSWLNHSGADSILCWFLLEFLRLLFSNYPMRYLTLLMNVQNWYTVCLRKATEMFLEAVFADGDWYWEISESWLISCYPTHKQHTRELRDWGYCPPEVLSQTQNILTFIWSHTTQPDIIFTNSCVLATSETDSLRTWNYVPIKCTKYLIVKSFVEVFFLGLSVCLSTQINHL